MRLKRILMALLSFLIYTSLLSSQPMITAIYPNHGPAEGGNTVTIHGSGFEADGVTAVLFGSTPAKFSITDDHQILAVAPTNIASTVKILVTTATESSHIGEEVFYAYQGDWYAYLISRSSNHITPFNLTTHLAEPSFSIGCSLAHMVIAPNGKMGYLTDRSLNAVIPINLLNHSSETPISVEEEPSRLAIHPDGKTLYVVNEKSATITLIDLITHTVKLSIPIGNHPKDIVIPFNGLTAYVSDGVNSVIPINLITNALGESIPTGLEPTNLITDYDGQMLYVLNKRSNTVTPITIATHTPKKPIPLKIPSDGLTITPDGKFIYVVHTDADRITPISLPDCTVLPSIQVGKKPKEMIITPNGKMAYVVNEGSKELIPIVLATRTLKPSIATELAPSSIVMAPDPSPIASYSYDRTEAGIPTTFDASTSVTSIGSLTHYIWDFGDEAVATTDSPTISHTYQHPGTYHVTLIVMNSAGTSDFTIFNSHTPSHYGGRSSISKKPIQVLKETKGVKENEHEHAPSSLLPPLEFRGKVIKNSTSSLKQHRLKWQASPDPRVVGYKLYRNGHLIKKFSNRKSFVFNQYGSFRKSVAYSLVAFDKDGQKSAPLTLTLH